MREERFPEKGRVIARLKPSSRDTEVNIFHINPDDSDINFNNSKIGDVGEVHKSNLIRLLEQYSRCFSRRKDDIGLTNLGELNIRVKSELPIYYRHYRLSIRERELVRGKIQLLKEGAGVIRDTNSAYTSPIVLIPKKGRDVRIISNGQILIAIDFRSVG